MWVLLPRTLAQARMLDKVCQTFVDAHLTLSEMNFLCLGMGPAYKLASIEDGEGAIHHQAEGARA